MITQSGLLRVLVRRWYATAAGLLLTLLLCVLATFVVSAKYEAKEAVLLVPPAGTTGSNPYLNLASLEGLNSVLVQALDNTATGDRLHAEGVTGAYTIADDPNSSGPVLVISGTAATPTAAISVVRHVSALVPQTLQQLQAQLAVPRKAIVTTTVLSPADKATTVRKSQIRALIVAAAAGIFGTLLVVAGLDNLLRRRASRPPRRPTQIAPMSKDATFKAEAIDSEEEIDPETVIDAEPGVYSESETMVLSVRGWRVDGEK